MIINASVAPLSYPFIGYDNVVLSTNVTASSADGNFPVSNVGNPALNLKWQASAAGNAEFISATIAPHNINYIAIAGHNFNSQNIPVTATAYGASDFYTKALLHFETDFTDEIGNVWTTPVGSNANISSLHSRYGRGSLALDGTGDFITTPDNVGGTFNLAANDFTIEMWIKPAPGTDAVTMYFCGQLPPSGGGTINGSFYFARVDTTGNNTVQFITGQLTGGAGVGSITPINVARGWTHVAAVRGGGFLRMYVDGVQESIVAIAGSLNDSGNSLGIGCLGDFTGSPWNGWIDEFRFTNGIARYSANFTPPDKPFDMQIADPYEPRSVTDKSVLHFDGPNNSTVFRDEVGTIWAATGTAKIDSVEMAGFFDGASRLTTTDAPRFTLGTSDFTVETWFKVNAAVGQSLVWYAQSDIAFTASERTLTLYRGPFGEFVVELWTAAGQINLGGTTKFAKDVNPGWHHIALVRSGTVFRLFLDGVQEGSVSSPAAMNDSSSTVSVGGLGANPAVPWVGWLDEFRMSIGPGAARYTSNFTPSPRLTSSRVPPDDGPMVFRFPTIAANRVQIAMRPGSAAPQVAVMYAGTLLDLERSIDINTPHTPINMGRKSNVASGKAENGKFIGRIVLGEWNEGSIDFKWFTPTWYRANFDPFLNQAVENPFFIAWNPVEYPLEVGYVSMTSDPKPEVDPVTKRVGVTLDFQGESS